MCLKSVEEKQSESVADEKQNERVAEEKQSLLTPVPPGNNDRVSEKENLARFRKWFADQKAKDEAPPTAQRIVDELAACVKQHKPALESCQLDKFPFLVCLFLRSLLVFLFILNVSHSADEVGYCFCARGSSPCAGDTGCVFVACFCLRSSFFGQ